jgi:hypothetical protein
VSISWYRDLHGALALAYNLFYRWIAGKISEILGNEDDVVIELCFNLIEGTRYVSASYDLSVA